MQKPKPNNLQTVKDLLADALGRAQELVDHQTQEVSRLEQDVLRLQAQAQFEEQSATATHAKLDELRGRYSGYEQKRQQEISGLDAKIQQLTQELHALATDKVCLQDTITNLQDARDQLEASQQLFIDEQQDKLAALDSQVAARRQELDELEQTYKGRQDKLDVTIADIRQQIDSLKAEQQSLEAVIATDSQKLATVQSATDDARDELVLLSHETDGLKAKRDQLEADQAAFAEERQRAIKALDGRETSLNEREQQLAEKERRLNRRSSVVDKLE